MEFLDHEGEVFLSGEEVGLRVFIVEAVSVVEYFEVELTEAAAVPEEVAFADVLVGFEAGVLGDDVFDCFGFAFCVEDVDGEFEVFLLFGLELSFDEGV